MKKILISTLLLYTVGASAQQIKVTPLYDNSTLRTHLSMPFKLTVDGLAVDSIDAINITKGTNCKTLIDHQIKGNFFVRCTDPSTVDFSITFQNKGKMQSISYSGLQVKKISESGTIVETGPAIDERYARGEELYNKSATNIRSCSSCHQAPTSITTIRAQTASSLKNLLTSNNNMKGQTINESVNGGLSNQQLEDLIHYIKNFKH